MILTIFLVGDRLSERARSAGMGVSAQPQSCVVSAGGKDRERWKGIQKSEMRSTLTGDGFHIIDSRG